MAIVVLAVIVCGIVIGSAVYTQAQLDAAAELAVAGQVPRPLARVAPSGPASDTVRTASGERSPESRLAIR